MNVHFLDQIEREAEEAKRHLNTLQPPWKAGFYSELEFLRLSLHRYMKLSKDWITAFQRRFVTTNSNTQYNSELIRIDAVLPKRRNRSAKYTCVETASKG